MEKVVVVTGEPDTGRWLLQLNGQECAVNCYPTPGGNIVLGADEPEDQRVLTEFVLGEPNGPALILAPILEYLYHWFTADPLNVH